MTTPGGKVLMLQVDLPEKELITESVTSHQLHDMALDGALVPTWFVTRTYHMTLFSKSPAVDSF